MSGKRSKRLLYIWASLVGEKFGKFTLVVFGKEIFGIWIDFQPVAIWYRSEVTSHLLATFTRATRILDTLNSITLKWYNTQELTHSKILAYNHVQKTKSKFKSHGMFTRYLLLKSYATLFNGVVVMVSAHQFCSFFNLLVVKTGFISSFIYLRVVNMASQP